MTGNVYLIGAGCGSYDLITLRGLRLLGKCSCVIYDALIDERLLAYAPENAELICVGKRSGHHSAKQEDINALLVEKALGGATVARLKGGDPFVFGRGGEEVTELQKHGIAYTVVPGITSSVAAAELAGIPVTHRRVSRSFHVITGHTADGGEDFAEYSRLGGTLVFLMGLSHAKDIADGLLSGGMNELTPAAIVSNGGTPRQSAVRTTLGELAETAADCEAPAVIVVGETAAFDFSPTFKLPLSGHSVSVTGTKKFTCKLAALLEAEGADVYPYARVKISPRGHIPYLMDCGCIVLTSVNGAEFFIEHLRRERIDVRTLAHLRFAAVGSATAAALENAGIYADIVPEIFTVAQLGKTIAANIRNDEKVLILRAENGSPELTDILSRNGVSFNDVKIYDTVAESKAMPESVDTDYIIFGSSFGVRSFFESSALSSDTTVACIGTKTAETAEKYTNNRILTASVHTAQGVVTAIKEDILK